jgi:hypothetical protein
MDITIYVPLPASWLSGNQYVTTSEVRNVTKNIDLPLYVYQERRPLHSTMSNTMALTAGKYHCRGKGTVSMSTDQVYSRTALNSWSTSTTIS